MESKKISKTDFAKSIGYTIHSLDKVLKNSVVTVVQFDNLSKFCEVYGYDMDFFIKNNGIKEVNRSELNATEVRELAAVYKTGKIKNIEVIENQFSKIEKTETFMISLLENGLNLLKQMQTDTQVLKEVVGVK